MAQFEQEIETATKRAERRLAHDPRAVSAHYDAERGEVVIKLSTGPAVAFPSDRIQGLAGAAPSDLAEIEITPPGYGLHFPRLDADLWVPALLEGVFGSRAWMAARLGAQGGKATSAAKAAAARENGKRRGRPLWHAHVAATPKRSAPPALGLKAAAKPKLKGKSKGTPRAIKASARRKAASQRRPQRSKVRA